MALLRSILSPILLTALLLATEGVALSIHICCGSVEAIGLYQNVECCCGHETDADSACTITEHSDCCSTSDAYLLLPVGAARNHDTPVLLPMVAALVPSVPQVQSNPTSLHSPSSDQQQLWRCSPPMLQTFRL
ncbi:MAG: hypothetical protein KatS3mg039_0036 [Candidatus Kapaibacterium sp.]|nr:MAG: hypothetical protein KatS3mg039_0036 [Candidatus Kapabacteria bacterium]